MATEIKRESARRIKEDIEGKLTRYYGRTLESASDEEMFQAVALCVRNRIVEQWVSGNEEAEKKGLKRLYYLSAEFLMGRALVNNMINLGALDEYREALREIGYPLEKLEAEENEAGLGNGGLGRLAACLLDSLSTLDLPATGCGIRYEYGIFRQRIVDGAQVEVPDDWTQLGDVWEIERPGEMVEVHYGGTVDEIWTKDGLRVVHRDYQAVAAIPYDMPVMGYESRMPATLRLWRSECPATFDLQSFNKGDYACMIQQKELAESISKVLYPEDDHIAGRMLRLKQFYFLASATVQYIVRDHKRRYGDLRTLPDKVVMQINDTHPTLAIPELMRILLDEEHMGWDDAYGIVSRVFNYTNHTVMQEALEAWPEQLFKSLLPRIYSIVKTINDKFSEQLWKRFSGDWDRISKLSIIAYDEIRMANLCIAVCAHVNGVSQLHGDILKTKTFRDFYAITPQKFLAITNGITPRRWLASANPALAELIGDHIGHGFLRDWSELEKLKKHLGNKKFLAQFAEVKRENKRRLAEYVYATQGVELSPDWVFDTQAKRLHEYKRQLLKVLHILHLYNRMTEEPSFSLPQPVVFLFAAKASPGYQKAKNIIRLINAVGALVNNDPRTKDKIKVVFLENYNVSLAERLIPATEISEQLSTAGREASGTGNMKFMLGGAVTLGTLDGANVEMLEQVGPENIFIFGAHSEEIAKMEADGSYHPLDYFNNKVHIRMAVSRLVDGTLPVADKELFRGIYNSLLMGDYDRADKYFLLYDFDAYDQAFAAVLSAYADAEGWVKKSAANTACAGFFSADRTVEEYNRQIWGLEPV